ncbi:MAG: class I SAM-dependent methyltransferase [Candidatus Eisenbacteria bacterium]
MDDYKLLDSGGGKKLERFGPFTLERPAAQAAWRPRLDAGAWRRAHASFDRTKGNRWRNRSALPDEWEALVSGTRFLLSPTDFGHVGVFPEQGEMWPWVGERVERHRARTGRDSSILNLFAYTGGATLASARAGAEVCHLDSSRGMVERARENAARNGLGEAPIRWIVEDVAKFLRREIRRGRRYDGLVLDPPSFGRGRRGEVFKIHDHIHALLDPCAALLSERPAFLLLTCHTPEFSPRVLHNLLVDRIGSRGGAIESGEMLLRGGKDVLPLPSGAFVRWTAPEAE